MKEKQPMTHRQLSLLQGTLFLCVFYFLSSIAMAEQGINQKSPMVPQGPSLAPISSFSEPTTLQPVSDATTYNTISKKNSSPSDYSLPSNVSTNGLPKGLTNGGYIDIQKGMSNTYSNDNTQKKTQTGSAPLSAPDLYTPHSTPSTTDGSQGRERLAQTEKLLPEITPANGARSPLGGKAEMEITLLVPEQENDQIAQYYKSIAIFLNKQAKGAIKLTFAPGRGGADALNRLVLEKNNGSFMAGMLFPTFLLQPMLPDKRFDSKAVVPLVILSATPTVLWVAEKSPIKSIEDLVKFSKRKTSSNYIAGTGSNTGYHMTTYVFNRAAGVSFQYLPYIGSKQASEAVLKGTAVACWGAGTPTIYMRGLRPLAIAAPTRSPFYPNIPTFSERGITLDASDQIGICVPATADEEMRKVASDLFISIATDPSFVEKTSKLGFVPTIVSYANMAEYITSITEALHTFLDNYPMGL